MQIMQSGPRTPTCLVLNSGIYQFESGWTLSKKAIAAKIFWHFLTPQGNVEVALLVFTAKDQFKFKRQLKFKLQFKLQTRKIGSSHNNG